MKFFTSSTTSLLSRRFYTIKTLGGKADNILIAQRGKRPISPHLTIYQPQLTWFLSAIHRISGIVLATGFYSLTVSFGISGLFGLGLTADNLVEWYRNKIPKWSDYFLKAYTVYLFSFHFTNGLRHLLWDFGYALTIKGVYRTGYTVLAATAALGTSLLFR